MKKNMLYTLWAAAFAVCAALGFFLPPALLLFTAKKTGDSKTLGILRTVSLTSLGLTLALLVLNILFAAGSRALGNFLHGLLAVVSAPMMALGNWAVSMFLWACLFFAASQKKKKS